MLRLVSSPLSQRGKNGDPAGSKGFPAMGELVSRAALVERRAWPARPVRGNQARLARRRNTLALPRTARIEIRSRQSANARIAASKRPSSKRSMASASETAKWSITLESR